MATGRQFAIGLAIAVLLPLLTFYGLSTFSPRPERPVSVPVGPSPNLTPEEREAKLDKLRAEQTAYKEAEKVFNKRLFFVSIVIGYGGILVGGLRLLPMIGTGLLFGGLFTVYLGHSKYWGEIEDWERFLALSIIAVLVVSIAYRRLPLRNDDKATPSANS